MGKFIDMTGWIMKEHGVPESRLTVLYQDKEQRDKRYTYWICQCECGKIKSILGSHIRKGLIKSCGCYGKEFPKGKIMTERNIIPVGTQFGKLTVIEDLGLIESPYRSGRARASLCQCSCGSAPIVVFNSWLRSGSKHSCGCSVSRGEVYIRELLQKNNILFKEQYSFNDLLGKQNNKLRFDFGILDNNGKLEFLIEYDGEQHFIPARGNRLTYTLEQVQQRDKIKNDYCKAHNIILKRIPYTEKLNFSLDDIFSEKYNI